MNLDMSWEELARATGGRLARGKPEARAVSLSTDTRTLKDGEVFLALKGERFDAHDLLDEALARRALGWIVDERKLPAAGPAQIVAVSDTLKALQSLAGHHRRRFKIPVAGITGSNGKTTTKEMLSAICRRAGPTCSSPGNWNNHIGVPLSVLELTREHRYGVFELADSKPGDIAEVARIAQPTVAVITNIGPDHLEFYGTLERNFQTKAEILDGLPAEGRLVVNLDDTRLAGLETRPGLRTVTFGTASRACVRWSGENELSVDGRRMPIHLRSFGGLIRQDAAAAAAAAWAMGLSPEAIRQGLEDYHPASWRMEPMRHDSGCSVIFDAYNANPASMRAAIEAFCEEFAGQPKILVLGDMKELGALSQRFHQELGEWLASLPLQGVYLAGPEIRETWTALEKAKTSFPARYALIPAEWMDDLKGQLRGGNAVIFKASRAMRFEQIAQELKIQAIP